jgi:hypothetical protein
MFPSTCAHVFSLSIIQRASIVGNIEEVRGAQQVKTIAAKTPSKSSDNKTRQRQKNQWN